MKKLGNIYIILFFVLLFIDQLSKYLIRRSGGFYICNSGISFGIKIYPLLFYALWIAIALYLIYVIFLGDSKKIPNPKSQIPNNFQNSKLKIQNFFLLLILSGAVANIIDRLYLDCVIDFIDLRIWPVFNLADCFISLGAIGIIIKNLKHKS